MYSLPDSYKVGGCVRDSFLGRTPKDIDIVTSLMPDEVLRVFKHSYDSGSQFGTVCVLTCDEGYIDVTTMREDLMYKITTMTSEEDGPFFTPTDDIEKDLSRRDFTINAMAKSQFGYIVDPFDGQGDIYRRTIRAVGNPIERFKEDELRVLRAITKSLELGFTIEASTAVAMLNVNIRRVSCERIIMELEKMFAVNPIEAILTLDKYGLLKQLLPDIVKLKGCEQNPIYHPEGDAWVHTLYALQHTIGMDFLTQFAVLVHDIGKWKVREGLRYPNHDNVSCEIAEGIMRRFGFSNVDRKAILFAIKNHMKMHHLEKMRKAKRYALYRDPNWDLLYNVHLADISMRKNTEEGHIEWINADVENMPPEFIPLIKGSDLIDAGIPIGPLIGQYVEGFKSIQIAGIVNTRESALKFLQDEVLGNEEFTPKELFLISDIEERL